MAFRDPPSRLGQVQKGSRNLQKPAHGGSWSRRGSGFPYAIFEGHVGLRQPIKASRSPYPSVHRIRGRSSYGLGGLHLESICQPFSPPKRSEPTTQCHRRTTLRRVNVGRSWHSWRQLTLHSPKSSSSSWMAATHDL